MLPKKPQSWPAKVYAFSNPRERLGIPYLDQHKAGQAIVGPRRPVPTAEVSTENERAADTEATDGLSSCQRKILHDLYRADLIATIEQPMLCVPHPSRSLNEEFKAVILLIFQCCTLSIKENK